MKNETYVINFKLGEREKQARNWEQQTQADYCEKIIDIYKELLDKCFGEWKKTNYDNYFEEMKDYIKLIDKIKNVAYNLEEPIKIKIYYDYNYERFIIEKQIDM